MVLAGRSRQGLLGVFAKARLSPSPLRSHVAEPEQMRPLPGDDDQVGAGRKEVGPEPEALAAQPFDAVANGRPAQLARDDDSESGRKRCRRGRLGRRLCRDQKREMLGRDASRLGLNAQEVRPPP